MKKTLLSFVMLVCLGNLFAQEATPIVKKVAMLKPIVKGGDVTTMQKEVIRGSLTKALTNTSDFEAFTRADIDAITNEQLFQQTGVVSDDQRVRMGQLSGANIICLSSVTLEGTFFYVEVSLIDVKTGKIIKTADGLMNNNPITEVQAGCIKLAEELVVSKKAEIPLEVVVSKIKPPLITKIDSAIFYGSNISETFHLSCSDVKGAVMYIFYYSVFNNEIGKYGDRFTAVDSKKNSAIFDREFKRGTQIRFCSTAVSEDGEESESSRWSGDVLVTQ